MLRSQTANLPSELQQHLHADFLANEQAYLQMRERLLPQYSGQWVAVQDDHVIAAGADLRAVLEAAGARGGHPYIARVGAEDETVFRFRRVEFAYDSSYRLFALPITTITFRNHAETYSQTYSDVIPDTGADTCVLPMSDCAAFDLFSSPYFSGLATGIMSSRTTALFYWGKAEVNGTCIGAVIQPLAGGQERLVGRDVLNQHRVVFDGPGQRVVFEP